MTQVPFGSDFPRSDDAGSVDRLFAGIEDDSATQQDVVEAEVVESEDTKAEETVKDKEEKPKPARKRRASTRRKTPAVDPDVYVAWDDLDRVMLFAQDFDALDDLEKRIFQTALNFADADEIRKGVNVARTEWGDSGKSDLEVAEYMRTLASKLWGDSNIGLAETMKLAAGFGDLGTEHQIAAAIFANGLSLDKLTDAAIDVTEQDSITLFSNITERLTKLKDTDASHTDWLSDLLSKITAMLESLTEEE